MYFINQFALINWVYIVSNRLLKSSNKTKIIDHTSEAINDHEINFK